MDGSATNLVQSDEAATLGVTLGQNTPESGASSIALDNTPSTLAAAENSYIPLPVNALVVQSEHQAMLDKVNALRASQGVAPLTWNSNLTDAAMQRAIEIALRFSHTRPHGDLCNTANPEIFGENIAYALIPKGNSSTDLIYEGVAQLLGALRQHGQRNYSSTALGHIKPTSASEWNYLWVQLFSFSNVPGKRSLRATASAPLSFPCRLTQPKA
ncbi:MAG: CAP domain-containing protein [Slackia sp.]